MRTLLHFNQDAKKIDRRPGAWRGRVRIARDFDAPLPDDVLADFEGDA